MVLGPAEFSGFPGFIVGGVSASFMIYKSLLDGQVAIQ